MTSRIRVTGGSADALAARPARRLGAADAAEGCGGVEVLRCLEAPNEFIAVARRVNAGAYERCRAGPAFPTARAHIRGVPGGIKIERVGRGVERFEVLS